MVVNSFNFFLFFVIVFVIYYSICKDKAKMQNAWLLIASYFAYGIVEWKMLFLLLISTVIFYFLGIQIAKDNTCNERRASYLTTIGVWLGVGMLLNFKYLNFFVESFADLFRSFGLQVNNSTFNIIMPLGISFFTFKLIAYIVEVHREKMEPCVDFVAFATFISFFPTILSGPIDRPKAFITQLYKPREFDYKMATDGCKQILWGMFKKMVIADSLNVFVTRDVATTDGSTLFIVAIMYFIQMYTDFSGYSDMAIGVGKLLNIKVAKNFNYPWFSRNVAEYWRGWHMSLTSWLTDYVFMPLNIRFRDWGTHGTVVAIVINLIVVGFWHGANWTYGLFGLYHGLLFIPLMYSGAFFKKKKLKTNKYDLPSFTNFLKMIGTCMLFAFGLLIFKSNSVPEFFQYVTIMFGPTLFNKPAGVMWALPAMIFTVYMVIFEWRKRKYEIPLFGMDLPRWARWSVYVFLILCIVFYQGKPAEFIYFKF